MDSVCFIKRVCVMKAYIGHESAEWINQFTVERLMAFYLPAISSSAAICPQPRRKSLLGVLEDL